MTNTRIVTAARLLKGSAPEPDAAPKASESDRLVDPANREAYFTNQHLRELYGGLIARLLKESGLFVLVGEKGIGKTALVHRLAVELDRAGALVVREESSSVSFESLGAGLAKALDVPHGEDQSAGILSRLSEAAASRAQSGRAVVLVVDRAETLGADALHSLRDLLVSREGVASGMRVVLSGRPELARRLALPAFGALLEQERWRGQIGRLSEDDIASLVWHRLRRCGFAGSHALDAEAIEALAELSKGVPGRAIAVARAALEQAVAAGSEKVPPALVAQAARAVLTLGAPAAKRPGNNGRLVTGIAVALLAAGIGLTLVFASTTERVAGALDRIARAPAGPQAPGNLTSSAQAGAFDDEATAPHPEAPLHAPGAAMHGDLPDAPAPIEERTLRVQATPALDPQPPGTPAPDAPSSRAAPAPPPIPIPREPTAQEPLSERMTGTSELGDTAAAPEGPERGGAALADPASPAGEGSSPQEGVLQASGETAGRETGAVHERWDTAESWDETNSPTAAEPPAAEESRAPPELAPKLPGASAHGSMGEREMRATEAPLIDSDAAASADLAPRSPDAAPPAKEDELELPVRAANPEILPVAIDQSFPEPARPLGPQEAEVGGDEVEGSSTGMSPETEAASSASTEAAIDRETLGPDFLQAPGDGTLRQEAAPPLPAPAAVLAESTAPLPAPSATVVEAGAIAPEAEASSTGAPSQDTATRDTAQTLSPPQASEPAPSSSRTTAMLVERGNALLKTGDVSGARLLYVRAAAAGDPEAALAAGKTYDRAFLAQIGVRGGVRADPEKAAAWYRRAAELGNAEASARLRAMTEGKDR